MTCPDHTIPMVGCVRCVITYRSPPAAVPHKCPVCDGAGKVSRPPHVPGDVNTWMDTSAGAVYDCRACDGSGVVWRQP